MVIVMADRGLDAPWLSQQLVALGWHPLVRGNEQGDLRPQGSQQELRCATAWGRKPGEPWSGAVECGQDERVCCTILIPWEVGDHERWGIVTALPPEESQGAWDRRRFWIEGSCNEQKRGGWQWHHTKLRDPRRAGRRWLAMAVAPLWVVGVGGNAEAEEAAQKPVPCPPQPPAQAQSGQGVEKPPRGREESCLLRGRLLIVAALLRAEPLPLGRFVPHAWPTKGYPVLKTSAAWAKQHKRKDQHRRTERKRDHRRRQKTYP
jgi:hypothetical protein